ncbi:MAG: hypothetical protein ACREON_12045 [Gemmatimonadaceae bacterium]
MSDLPIACTLTPEEMRTRTADLLPALARSASQLREVREVDRSGFVLTFERSAERLAQICRVIEQESACCAFLRFDLTVEPGGGPLVLSVTGPPGTKEFFQQLVI